MTTPQDAPLTDWNRLSADLAYLTLASAMAAMGAPGEGQLTATVRAHTAAGFDPERMREALLQTMLFGGYPCALNALGIFVRALADISPDVATSLRDTPLEPATPKALGEWDARGKINAQRVYGSSFDKLMANARQLSPDLAEWMLGEGYGRVLGRPNLDFPTRECCIVATLIPLRVGRQLFSHMRGCLNVGIPKSQVEIILDLIAPHVPPDAAALALATWKLLGER